jgi:hypothetical protein
MRLPAPCVCRTDSGAAAGDLALLILLDFLSPSKTHRQIQSGAWLRDCPRPFNGAHHMCNLERPLRRRGPTAISPVGKRRLSDGRTCARLGHTNGSVYKRDMGGRRKQPNVLQVAGYAKNGIDSRIQSGHTTSLITQLGLSYARL